MAGQARASLLDTIAMALERGRKYQKEKESGQTSLFEVFAKIQPEKKEEIKDEYLQNSPPWNEKQLLACEKEVTGFFISGHPLQNIQDEIKLYTQYNTISNFCEHDGKEITLCGTIASLQIKTSKNTNRKFAFAMLEDLYGQIEMQMFSKILDEHEDLLKTDDPLIIQGKIGIDFDKTTNDTENDTPAKPLLRVNNIIPIDDYRQKHIAYACFELNTKNEKNTIENLNQLNDLFTKYPGNCTPFLKLNFEDINV